MTGPGGVRGPGGFPALRSGQIQGDEARLRTSANLLESEFTATLFRAMRDTVPQESPGADGAQDIFWSMLEREVADQSAMGGGLGLGRALYEALADRVSHGAGDGAVDGVVDGAVDGAVGSVLDGASALAAEGAPDQGPLYPGRMNLNPLSAGESP